MKRAMALGIAGIAMGLATLSCTENAPSSNSRESATGKPAEFIHPNIDESALSGNSGAVSNAPPGSLRSLSDIQSSPAPAPAPSRAANQQPNASGQPTFINPGSASVNQPKPPPHVVSDGPTIPKDAQWTIFCTSITGSDHQHQATVLKNQLIQATHMKDFYLVISDTETSIKYGFYAGIEPGEKDAERAKADRMALSQLVDANGGRVLQACWLVQLATDDPQAPPEWNLANVNNKLPMGAAPYYWTLEVASYRGGRERKQYAVDAVRDFRERGVPAYYFHGKTTSSVCIGAWPETAVKRDQTAPDTVDPMAAVIVEGSNLPGIASKVQTPDGEAVQKLRNSTTIMDESLRGYVKRYPYHYLNGTVRAVKHTDPKTQKTEEIPDSSFLALIPGNDADPNAADYHPYSESRFVNPDDPNNVLQLQTPTLPADRRGDHRSGGN